MINKEETQYKGYKRINFTLNGYTASVIFPMKPLSGFPWIWRAEFLGDFDQADMELVNRGWHLVYYKISNQYGSPDAVLLMNQFHDYIVNEFKLYDKTVLLGFSRGGLYAVNYAVAYPNKVASLYLDAPVIDLQSWPKGNGRRPNKNKQWEDCLACYGFTDEIAIVYAKTQLNRADVLASNKIPVLIVAGDEDLTVPYIENGQPFVEQYKKTHDNIRVFIKKGCAHHPHSLVDVTAIVDFIEKSIKK